MQFLWTMIRFAVQSILDALYRIEHKIDLLTHNSQLYGDVCRAPRPGDAFEVCPTCLDAVNIQSIMGYCVRSCGCDRKQPHALPQEIPTSLARTALRPIENDPIEETDDDRQRSGIHPNPK